MKQRLKKIVDKVSFFNINALATTFLLCTVVLFDSLPVVQDTRASFVGNTDQACDYILAHRPWYGQINPWTWLWFFFTPMILFSVKPSSPSSFRALVGIFATLISYGVLLMATTKAFDIINAPFYHLEITPQSSDLEVFKYNCFNTSDGASFMFALMLGWLPGVLYLSFWQEIWIQYHRRITNCLDQTFRRDLFGKITTSVSFVTLAVLGSLLIKHLLQ